MSFFGSKKGKNSVKKNYIWARPGMDVIFRAELMPGKNKEERTFKVKEVLENDRVLLEDAIGEHRQNEFEPIRY